jgi:hypothetical protein
MDLGEKFGVARERAEAEFNRARRAALTDPTEEGMQDA